MFTFYEANFGNATLHIPIFRNESVNMNVQTRAFHNKPKPFYCFEAEPTSDGSTDKDAHLSCFS